MAASPLTLVNEPDAASVLPFRRERTQDWAAVVCLIQDAAERMRADAEQAHWRETLVRQELESAQAQIDSLEARLHATETRAHEAEVWLRRIHDAIVGELPPGLDLLESLSGSVLAKLTGDTGLQAPTLAEAEHSP